MQPILSFVETLFTNLSINPWIAGALGIVLFLGASWLVTLVGYFFRIERPRVYVSMLSIGMGLVVGVLLAGLCMAHLPDLALEFTPWGLLFFSTLIAFAVFSVPLMQCFLKSAYWQSLAGFMVGMLLFVGSILALQMTLQPVKGLSARPNIPLFQDLPHHR